MAGFQLAIAILPQMVFKEWFDFSKDALDRSHAKVLPSPFKANEPSSAFRRLTTIADEPEHIRPDIAHTYSINGWGKDLCGSSLVLLWRLHIFKSRSLQVSFDEAFADFREYCNRVGKTTSITEFTLKTLKVITRLGFCRQPPKP